MKKSIIISIVIFLIMSIFIGSVSAASTTVSLRASNANPKIGDTITITVSFSTPVGTASLNLNYNNNIVQYVSSSVGSATNRGSTVKIDYIDTSFQNKTITSMTVTFKVIAEGTANFTVSNAVLSNANAEELTSSISGGAAITVKNETNSQTPITKPTTPVTNNKPNTNTNTNTNKNPGMSTTTNNNNNQVQNNNVNSTTENLISNESNNENNNQINNVSNAEQNQDNHINEINQSEENKPNYKLYFIIAIIAIVIILVLAIIIWRIKNC